MGTDINIAKRVLNKAKAVFRLIWTSYPKNVRCNVCGWEGRHFASDPWHEHTTCPKCYSDIRQRLFVSALQNTDDYSFEKVINGKKILHFAPEKVINSTIKNKAQEYITADFLREDCDLKLDMSNMTEVGDASFDVVVAFDVLEHVPDYQQALEEVHRILTPKGLVIFTVPQQDNLAITHEDPKIVTPEDREKHYGQWDHLRMFGDDFIDLVRAKKFDVEIINESNFSKSMVSKNVLFPPKLSTHPLATNYRKVFFCEKQS